MNQVFITRPVGRTHEERGADTGDLTDIAAHILAAAFGGAVVAIVIAELGLTLRRLDPTQGALIVFSSVLLATLVVSGFQLRGRVAPLPERRSQVPRRWLGWRRRWLTAAAYGGLLGGGAFTPIRQATMYTLGLMVFLAPDLRAAALVGVIYGGNRGTTVLTAWLRRQRGSKARVEGFFSGKPLLLTVAAAALPIWIITQLPE